MQKLIYIADDEKNIRTLIKSFLEKEDYIVEAFENGDLLYEKFLEKECDLIILDIVMPGSSGLVICSKLREISNVPIIMLTARDTELDYISGITLGSDDYFTKPVSLVILTMRVKAMLRRVEMGYQSQKIEKEFIEYKDITMFPKKLSATCNNEELNLTLTEFSLLLYLFENQNKAVSREELLNKVWGYDNIVETRATDDTVKRLRRKLANYKSKVYIETVWGYGFKLNTK